LEPSTSGDPAGLPASASAVPAPELPYADRSTGLIIFGILEIIGGAFAALAIPLMFLTAVLSNRSAGGGMPVRSVFLSVLTYAIAAVVLIFLGVGAVQAKRWARALNLIVACMWLVGGAMVTLALVFVLPSATMSGVRMAAAQNPQGPQAPTGMMAVIVTLMIAFMAFFFVVLPVVFLLFYRSRNVEQTCRHRDPVERWTDRLPLPVIAYAMLAGFGAAYYFFMAFVTPLFPFFGRYLTGIPGGIACFVFAAIDAYVAFSFLRLNVNGWWLALVSIVIRIAAAATTYGRADILAAYARLGWSDAQLEAMQHNPMFRNGAFLWISLAVIVPYLGLLLWTKRYFRTPPAITYVGIDSPLSNPIQPGS